MAIIQGNAKQGSTRGFYPKTLEGSLRFNDDDSAYLSWTAKGGISERRTFTISCWVKKAKNGSQIEIFGTASEGDNLYFTSGDQLGFFQNGSADAYIVSNAKFRDPSAWYHIVCAVDTTQATASNRVKLYVNGEQITSFSSSTYPAQDNASFINNTVTNFLGKGHGSQKFDGYIAEFFMVAGTQHDADAFGETKNGVWVPKNITASDFTMGTNGFYLNFLDDTQVEAFNTVLWRGNSVIGHQVTGVGFEPDLVWMKIRSGQSDNHVLHDAVRGSNRRLFTNSTNAETYAQELISFDSDGFTLGSTDGSSNYNGFSYVGWCWDAGANNAVTGHSSVTYTGNGGTQKISGLPFSPDLVWIKDRSNARDSVIFDTVRGAANYLRSASTAAEGTSTTTLSSFDKDGFILGNNAANNNTSETYVAWGWDAGDSAPVSNTAGSITSTVKASTTNGFSIVSYTGTGANGTVGHGLSSKPKFILFKNRSAIGEWIVYHEDISEDGSGEFNFLNLNDTDASQEFGAYNFMQSTAPDATKFYVDGQGEYNGSGNGIIAYCWHDVTGKQKFGTYTGDGTSDGSLAITTGFRVGWLMIKRTDSAHDWSIIDASRSPFNPTTKELLANTSDSEATAQRVNFTDTGFELMNAGGRVNANGGTYIYAAFAGSYSDYITDYNTDGSIDSRVKASDTTGFSIISYKGNGVNGATVGHGLSAAPDFVITKTRTQAENWNVQHVDSQRLNLNLTGAQVNNYLMTFNPSTVTLTDLTYQNGNGYDMIMYAWKETTGYSKFGSYEGDHTNGVTVACGFEPSMVLIKNIDAVSDWEIYDDTRRINGSGSLEPNTPDAENLFGGNFAVTFGTTGFTLPAGTQRTATNETGNTYIYAAFADTREAAFWLDQSGNDNDWQPNNLDHNDTVADSPTDNFATLNPLCPSATNVYADGNLRLHMTDKSNGSSNSFNLPTIQPLNTGKIYYEFVTGIQTGTGNAVATGVIGADKKYYDILFAGNADVSGFYLYGGSVDAQNAGTGTAGVASYSNGDTIGIAIDFDNQKMYCFVNGSEVTGQSISSGTAVVTFPTTGDHHFFLTCGSNTGGSNTSNATVNFGQQPFKYDPPA